MKRINGIHVAVGLLCFLLLFLWMDQSPSLRSYIQFLKAKPSPYAASSLVKTEEQWMAEIQSRATERNIAPVDAKIDPVWKAIPGYNGREVDIPTSLKLSKDQGKLSIIYKEVEPNIKLEDLGYQPIYRGNSHKKMASIMINVAWGNEYIPPILDTLRQENVHATFFLDGSWLSNNMDVAKIIMDEGHELSNHAYSHKNMSQLSHAKAREEIMKTEQLLKQLGVENKFFAPPSGDFDKETVKIAKDMGLYTILWTLDTVDWKNPPPESIVKKISNNIEPGSLILMHPTASSSQSLSQMIQVIKDKNLALSTVSELLSSKRSDTVERTHHF
ncbi:polysaccharide deacetylase family protein [Longirhabdus pacifica]|uniref:polysaccharide deacetylase family protein n=1 Tax=Longirhabdus pacifica TaxID=2305227 RepID=UPI0010092A49|nr:polysaccharide deacetylase family protein [Longirhabdus pacifica]